MGGVSECRAVGGSDFRQPLSGVQSEIDFIRNVTGSSTSRVRLINFESMSERFLSQFSLFRGACRALLAVDNPLNVKKVVTDMAFRSFFAPPTAMVESASRLLDRLSSVDMSFLNKVDSIVSVWRSLSSAGFLRSRDNREFAVGKKNWGHPINRGLHSFEIDDIGFDRHDLHTIEGGDFEARFRPHSVSEFASQLRLSDFDLLGEDHSLTSDSIVGSVLHDCEVQCFDPSVMGGSGGVGTSVSTSGPLGSLYQFEMDSSYLASDDGNSPVARKPLPLVGAELRPLGDSEEVYYHRGSQLAHLEQIPIENSSRLGINNFEVDAVNSENNHFLSRFEICFKRTLEKLNKTEKISDSGYCLNRDKAGYLDVKANTVRKKSVFEQFDDMVAHRFGVEFMNSSQNVVDYFRWRDCYGNRLGAHSSGDGDGVGRPGGTGGGFLGVVCEPDRYDLSGLGVYDELFDDFSDLGEEYENIFGSVRRVHGYIDRINHRSDIAIEYIETFLKLCGVSVGSSGKFPRSSIDTLRSLEGLINDRSLLVKVLGSDNAVVSTYTDLVELCNENEKDIKKVTHIIDGIMIATERFCGEIGIFDKDHRYCDCDEIRSHVKHLKNDLNRIGQFKLGSYESLWEATKYAVYSNVEPA